ncbi:uncharacterized protein LOC113650825 [Tachysurus fulvidraco]|uniref:uncharacterized protein LOC113650825 n=1 Tax=Tachysurus fulvidraco TaxID=1234273 RepID=UPI001FEF85CF|nr:uncharacterized protein LOC113650825 [Tachysurus fulvidraco]
MPQFVIMLMILVIWFSQNQGREIYPAKIYSDKHEDKLKFTCSIFGLKNTPLNNQFYIYLCRNGIATDMKSGCQDVTFYIDVNRKDNTGNYSCVFSVHKYNLDQVIQNGINFILITTNDSFVPAEIALSQTNVITGYDAEFQCTSLNLPDRIQKGNVYAVLYKNSTVIQMTIWDMTKNKARFTLKEVSIQDAGTYICCLMSELFPFPKNVHGVNEVILHVTEQFKETLIIITGGAVSVLLIILCLGLVSLRKFQNQVDCFKGHSESYDPREAEMNQDEVQTENSSGTEWDQSSSNSDSPSYANTYQVCEEQ